jgi:hypothetical protein
LVTRSDGCYAQAHNATREHADIQTSMRHVHMANETLKSEIKDVFK